MLEIIPVEKIKEEPEDASIETVITLDDDTPQEIVFIKEEPYIQTCLVAKVKAESTTLDTAVIWPTSPSEQEQSEETVRIIQKIIALSCKQEPDDEITVVSEIFRGWNQEFRLEETQCCDQTSSVSDGFRGWSIITPDLSEKFKEWYKNQIQGLNEGVATSSIESPGNGSVIQDATSCSNYTHLKEKVTSLEDVIVSNTVHANIGNYVCCKCKRISGADVNTSSSNSGEDKFHCGVCSYVCSSSEDLKTHMRTHRDQNIGPVSFIEKDVSTTENLQCSQDLICNNNETDETLENNNIAGKNYKAGPLKKKITSDKSTSVSVIPEFNSVAKQSGSIKKINKFDNTTTSSNKTSAVKSDHKLKLYPVVVLDVIPKNVFRNDNHTIRNEEINGSNRSNETREAVDCENEEFCSTSEDNSKTGETVDDDQQNHTEKLTNKVSVEGGDSNSNKVGVKRKLLEESTSTVLYVNGNSNKVGVRRKLLEESTSTVLYVNGKCNTEEYRQQKISRCSVNKYRCQVCVFKTASKQCIEEHKKIHLPKKYKKKSKKRSRLTSVAKVSDSVSSVNAKVVETTDRSVSSVNTKVVETTDRSVSSVNTKVVGNTDTSVSSVNTKVVGTTDTVVPSDKTMDHNKSEKQKLLDILETRDSSKSVPPENQVIKTNERYKGLENYKIPKLSGKKVLHKSVSCNFESTHENLIKHARVHNSKPKQTDKDSAKVKRRPRQIYKCAECDYSSRSFRNLKFHGYRHSGEKPFSCKLCSYKCRRPETILPHMRMHYKDKPFKCSICGDKFTQSSSLKSHIRTHNGEKPYECDYCDYTCARISNLKYHLDTHSGIKPFKCNICGYKCSRSYSLKTHMRRHTGERPYKCTMCSHSAKNSSGLKVHMYTHTNYKPLKCKMCTYATPNPLTLEMHIRTHTGEKPYQCTECDFKTSRPACLKTHVRIHTGEKPFVCSICQFACARYSTLVCHIRTHTGQRPYECGTCSTKFTTKSALTIHTRIHTGEKPYKCTLCAYASYAAGELKKHVRRKHFNVDTTAA